MLCYTWILLALACSARSLIVRRQNDEPNPPGKTDPSTTNDCTHWVNVQPDDTCSSIARLYGMPVQDLIRFNPSLEDDCSGLTSGKPYCIEENFGNGPVATSKSTAITKLASILEKEKVMLIARSPASPQFSPTQPGIISTCRDFYKVSSGDNCQAIVNRLRTFTLSDFYTWNPAVGVGCERLFLGYYVCVGVNSSPTNTQPTATVVAGSGPSPTQTGIRSDCQKYYRAVSGDTCTSIATKLQTLTAAQFRAWNPAVGPTCSTVFPGYFYCVAVPAPTPTPKSSPTPTTTSGVVVAKGPQPQQPGTVSNCKKYYQVVAGDFCAAIQQRLDVSAGDFNLWNPGVGADCKGLFLGYYICVGV